MQCFLQTNCGTRFFLLFPHIPSQNRNTVHGCACERPVTVTCKNWINQRTPSLNVPTIATRQFHDGLTWGLQTFRVRGHWPSMKQRNMGHCISLINHKVVQANPPNFSNPRTRMNVRLFPESTRSPPGEVYPRRVVCYRQGAPRPCHSP